MNETHSSTSKTKYTTVVARQRHTRCKILSLRGKLCVKFVNPRKANSSIINVANPMNHFKSV